MTWFFEMDYNRAMAYKRKKKWTRKQKRKAVLEGIILFLAFVGALTIVSMTVEGVKSLFQKEEKTALVEQPELDVQLLTVNEYSRPGLALDEVNGIVIHYTANPGTGAQANRNYFEGLKDSHDTKASSHFVIGLNGEIIQCIPTSEMAYASNERNTDTIAIECCHPDSSGAFNQSTYDSLVHLTAWLCGKFDLSTEDVIRHYDVTGKDCPKYYVENPDAWERFLGDVDAYLQQNGV